MFNHKTILIAIISIVCALPILAQESSVVVSRVRIEIVDGNTREEALRRWLNVREDHRYDDLESLNSAVQRDVQELVNRRIFLSVEGRVEPSSQDETNQMDVIYTIVDANTFVPVPLPLYDSNTGGVQLLYVQIWDNMLGTMTDCSA
jgi:outer membrane protein assembly factor BamA